MTVYYHVIADECNCKMLMHNTKLRKGFFYTGEMMSSMLPEGTILSPYTFTRGGTAKEQIWERIRSEEFPELPSRIQNPIYLFEDQRSLEMAKKNWWRDENLTVLKVNLIETKKIHKVDSQWLNCEVVDYEKNARAYWSGDETENSLFEIIFQGIAFFPDWENFPLFHQN